MNDLPVTRCPFYAQRILGSLGGNVLKSLERNVWRKVVSSSKAVNIGQRVTLFCCDFVRSGVD